MDPLEDAEHTMTKKSTSRRRPAVISFRARDEERAELERQAEAAGLTLSDYARAQVLAAAPLRARRRPSVDRIALAKLLAGIGQIGNNVNQIARNLNSDRNEDQAFVNETLTAVRQMRDAVLVALGINQYGGK